MHTGPVNSLQFQPRINDSVYSNSFCNQHPRPALANHYPSNVQYLPRTFSNATSPTPRQMSSPNQSQVSAPIAVLAVREDHLAAIIRFVSLQHTVVTAAVPRHLYGIQAEAHRQLVELMPIIDGYRFTEDATTITVDLDRAKRQKMVVSPKALTRNLEAINVAKPTSNKVQPQVSITDGIAKIVQVCHTDLLYLRS